MGRRHLFVRQVGQAGHPGGPGGGAVGVQLADFLLVRGEDRSSSLLVFGVFWVFITGVIEILKKYSINIGVYRPITI